MTRLNGPPLGKWDPHEAAEAWYTAPKTGVRQVTKKRKVRPRALGGQPPKQRKVAPDLAQKVHQLLGD